MKVAVVSRSGSIGKTVIATHLLKSMMPDAVFFSMEDINRGAESLGVDSVKKVNSNGFEKMLGDIFLVNSAIIDVGASNVRFFLDGLKVYRGSSEEIDYFVVPLKVESRYQEEAMQTIAALKSLGVDDARIRPIFNQVEESYYQKDDFKLFLNYLKSETKISMNPDCILFSSPGIETMSRTGRTISAVLSDDTDYGARIRELVAQSTEQGKEPPRKEIEKLTQMKSLRMCALPLMENIQKAWDALNLTEKVA